MCVHSIARLAPAHAAPLLPGAIIDPTSLPGSCSAGAGPSVTQTPMNWENDHLSAPVIPELAAWRAARTPGRQGIHHRAPSLRQLRCREGRTSRRARVLPAPAARCRVVAAAAAAGRRAAPGALSAQRAPPGGECTPFAPPEGVERGAFGWQGAAFARARALARRCKRPLLPGARLATTRLRRPRLAAGGM